MRSLLEWRVRKLHEIAIATNPEHIIRGAPTLDSVKESIWGNSKVPPNIPTSEAEPVANGEKQIPEERDDEMEYCEPDSTAPSVSNSGLVSQKPILSPGITRTMRQKLPVKLNQGASDTNLGDRGMGYIGASTFKNAPAQAGEIPTVSHGMPVGGPTGQFGAI